MFVLSMAARNVSQFIVENIHVQLEESDIALNMTNLPKDVKDNNIVIAASLLMYHGGQSAPTLWNGLHVLVCNVNITLVSSQNVQAFGMITLTPQNRSSIAGVDVTISNGTCMHFSVDVSQLFSARTLKEIKPSFVAIYCPPDSKELYECEATNVTIFIGDRHHAQHPTAATVSSRRNINLFLEEAIPGTQGAIEMVALISIRDASVIQNIDISIPGGSDGVGSETTTYLTARCICKGSSCSRLLYQCELRRLMSLRECFTFKGQHKTFPCCAVRTLQNFSFAAAGAGALVVVLDAAKTGPFFGSFSYFSFSSTALMSPFPMIEGSQVLVRNRGADIGSSSRNIGVFEISNTDNATIVSIIATAAMVSVDASSGGCAIAAATVVGFLGNISHSTVTLTNVSLLAMMDNGTTLVLPVSLFGAMLLTMVTNLVNINAQDPHYMDVGRGIRVVVTNSSVRAMHTSNFPSAFIDSSSI
ncbi:transmembrane protein, putative [Bodo saltans]|uniref:Transmembrane protein, putative n=1 Tax=Bodo saltans TaxID=75058 RepID=A0A0S4J0M3_BODSA|nr:transmembrane protein, putative [Bodo saltans]|eukprot:CUG74458.1 transmembrane protein, putative [Bodo saltans]